jgi:hypothetical protein
VECGFCWVFCESWGAKRGFLRGKRGEVVVQCVAGNDRKKLAENRTAFWQIYKFILGGRVERFFALRIV